MGFLNALQRMAQGKQPFEDTSKQPDQKKSEDQGDIPGEPQASGPRINKSDHNSFPVAYVKRVSTKINGSRMEVYCQIVNKWPAEILLDKIIIAGATHEIDDYLDGGEEQEVLVYSGPLLAREYRDAQLHYKTREEGDYFEAIHDVTFKYHTDSNTYSISDIRFRPPIRDIYG